MRPQTSLASLGRFLLLADPGWEALHDAVLNRHLIDKAALFHLHKVPAFVVSKLHGVEFPRRDTHETGPDDLRHLAVFDFWRNRNRPLIVHKGMLDPVDPHRRGKGA